MKIQPAKQLVYLDHASTTPVREEVLRTMLPFLQKQFGNPSSLYKLGVDAKKALETSRKVVASCLGARPEEITFTSGGTESVNLAILGVARAHRRLQSHFIGAKGKTLSVSQSRDISPRGGEQYRTSSYGHIITSKIEHHTVLKACRHLESEGYEVSYIGVDSQGFFDLEEFKKNIRPDTFLVTLMYANNEVGAIEPIRRLAKIIREENQKRILNNSLTRKPLNSSILLHTDACQASGFLDLNVLRLGVDLMTINASKIYGPKGVGALFARKGLKLEPLMYGGGQEKEMRSGTENVAGVVGFAKAFELAQKERQTESKRLSRLRNGFLQGLQKKLPKSVLNGPIPPKSNKGKYGQVLEDNRLPNNINVSFPGYEGEALMLYLDHYNIAVSTGSACTSGETDASHVLLAMGRTEAQAKSSIRFSLGRSTTKAQLDYVLKVLLELVKQLAKVVSNESKI